jgi:hypothetical protein
MKMLYFVGIDSVIARLNDTQDQQKEQKPGGNTSSAGAELSGEHLAPSSF